MDNARRQLNDHIEDSVNEMLVDFVERPLEEIISTLKTLKEKLTKERFTDATDEDFQDYLSDVAWEIECDIMDELEKIVKGIE